MNDSEKWDRLLKQALAPTAEPDEELNQNLMNRIKESSRMNRGNRKRVSVGILVVIFTLVISVSAFAATKLFNSNEVAEHLGDSVLAQAFESNDATEINQSIESGDYNFTLHGIVSGTGLSQFNSSAQEINPDRTYAVVSIARLDGSSMPSTNDPEYGKETFFVSPFIKGVKPWQVNIMTMNGGYSEVVRDGIMYRLIECDGVEMFADRGVYMAINSGTFYDNKAFTYNEDTGEISSKTNYKGISVLFDLPLDKTKADPAKAEAYLQELLKVPPASDKAQANADLAASIGYTVEELEAHTKEIKKKVPDGKVIPESVKEVTYDDEGRIRYQYKDWNVTVTPDLLFGGDQKGFSDAVDLSKENGKYISFQFSRDENGEYKVLQFMKDDKGVITGRIVHVK